ncbi:hypothetical protein D9M68_934700 [compost metagenome]
MWRSRGSGVCVRKSSGASAPIVCRYTHAITMGRISACAARSTSHGRNFPRSMPRRRMRETCARTGPITSRFQQSASPGKCRTSVRTSMKMPPAWLFANEACHPVRAWRSSSLLVPALVAI